MEITDVRIRLSIKGGSRVKAFATITLDDSFVVRDMRIIEGRNGLFVAMPSRPLKEPCPQCGYRNPVRSKHCAGCGSGLTIAVRPEMDDRSLHRDVAHPITQEMREYIHNKIIEAYKLELENSGSEPTATPTDVGEKAPEVEQLEEKKLEEEQQEEKAEETEEEKAPEVATSRFRRKRVKTEAEPESTKETEEEKPEEEKPEEEVPPIIEKDEKTDVEEQETPEVEQPEEEKTGEESEEAGEEKETEEKESGKESEEVEEEKKDE